MVLLLKAALLGAATLATAVYSQKIVAECGAGLGKCPSDKPCCSQYGQCGVGAYCLGGCDPKFSNKLDSCVAAPVCQSKKHTFKTLDKVADKTKYLGDSSKYDWVADGHPQQKGDALLLTMPKGSVGTVLASTSYVWYGKVTATLKTSRGKGVVSAFILLSDMKDEIDFEWIGVDLATTQTNYYFQGIPDYNNGGNISLSDTFNNYHTYEIDWKPDQITWSIDGQVGRTLKKADTYNETTKVYDYPQTPSRIQLSLWPGGLATNNEGTINWAGGEIDWQNTEDMKKYGYYYATFKDVTVECYDPPSDAKKKGSKTYYYDDAAGLESDVVIGDKSTILKSFLATGTNMTADYPKSSTSSSSSKESDVETVPGLSGAGTGSNGLRGDSTGNSSSSSQGVTSTTNNGDSSATFSQGDDSTTPSGASDGRALQSSMLAIVVAVVGMMVM